MQIDRTSFLAVMGSLAVGGAGGYLAADRNVFRSPNTTEGAAPPTVVSVATATPVTAPPPPPAGPVCDDSAGSPGVCPPPGYSADETGCGALPTKRCEGFKQTMKPRVAEQAVACLNALTPAQRCDPARLSLCGHMALMGACAPDTSPSEAASKTAPPDDLGSRCEAVARGCTGGPFAPTMRECRATLAGMTPLGRDRVAACMSSHCGDKGLLGCETAAGPGMVAVGGP
jgi:hypothetical protein